MLRLHVSKRAGMAALRRLLPCILLLRPCALALRHADVDELHVSDVLSTSWWPGAGAREAATRAGGGGAPGALQGITGSEADALLEKARDPTPWISISKWLPGFGGPSKAPPKLRVDVFAFEDVAQHVQYRDAREGFPEQLQGIFWLDEGGFYGCQSQTKLSGGLHLIKGYALTFADGSLDLSKKDSVMGVKSRVYTNRPRLYDALEAGPKEFQIEWGEEYDVGVVTDYMKSMNLLFGERIANMYNQVQPGLVTPTLERQVPPASCPPPENAACEEKSKCASWVRKNHLATSVGLINRAVENAYYIFQIVDGQGQKVQPYFDKWLKYMTQMYGVIPPDEAKGIEARFDILGNMLTGKALRFVG